MKKILLAFAAVLIIFWFIWMAFPAATIQSIIEDSFGEGNIAIEIQGLKKGYFYTLSIDKATLRSSRDELFSFNNLRGRIKPFGLMRMRLEASMEGSAGLGKISGSVILAKKRLRAKLDYADVEIREAPFLQSAGIRGTGTISGRLIVTDDKGRVEFVMKNAAFEPMDFSGVKVPMNLFNEVTGALAIEGNVFEVISVSLTGKDIYARLKGSIKNKVADLRMELMPGASYLENPFFVSQVERYKASPGYYVIPVKGGFTL